LKYDVIIVGAGPAGIFTALELTKNSDLNILMLEKGKAIEKRNCPVNNKGVKCINCKPCSITCGWGGAGAFSDGKLTLTSAFGGVLDEYISKQKLEELIKYVDQVYVEFGATTEVHGTDEEKVREIERKAAAADLKLIPARVKHLGTDKCYDILRKMQYQLSEKVTIKTETPVKDILVDENTVYGVRTENGEEYYADYVVVVPGREGAEWFNEQTAKLKLKTKTTP